MKIGGLQKVTLIDYPGRIAATVFLMGCNFHCPWCYSRELVLPGEVKKIPQITKKGLFDFLKKRKRLLEGVVICGGEPCINKKLPIFIKQIKKLGFLVKLDTNGSNPKMLEKLIKERLIDYVAVDIKGPKERYNDFIDKKIDIKKIQKSIDILKEGKVDYEFRSTIVPLLHEKGDVVKMAKWIQGAKRYYLQSFRPEKTIDPEFKRTKPYSKERMVEFQEAVAPFFEVCQIR